MTSEASGLKLKNWASIKNPPYPAEGAGNQTFSFYTLLGIVLGGPLFLIIYFRLSLWFYPFLFPISLPIFAGYFFLSSKYATPYNNKVQLPGRKIEEYISIKDSSLAAYSGRNKIPMELFFENYFDEKIDLCGDALEILEARHDWASFEFTMGQFKFFLTQWIPETLIHSKKQDENQVRDHYDRGDDFYAAFLGPRMVYTSGIISDQNKRETLEEMQDNKLKLVCERMRMKEGERHLDIGCGWGTLVAYAAKNYGVDSTGITLGRNQTEFGNNRIKEFGVNGQQARIVCMDYRDIPRSPKYHKITCLEMAEHVGVRLFSTFLEQVRDMLEDDGLFFLQIAGLRRTWQYEDFIWGLFMAKYIFPGADASCPLGWVIDKLEVSGFEIQSVDTVGVHYSGTIWRWYQNWLKNKDTITEKYGKRWYRIWEIFLAWSTIISRQGSATCYQIVAHKNLNAFDRVELISKRLLSF
ncbi:Mycolic acid cyclopropane synthetase-domain-containing protein [Glomus cerebriforme]|uniref:sphingolipid C(9)-methyltransferase n=1 Tax=Glomus cerebriforme TaxID=658196 RepID=A0A397SYZ6_9GLOM|nr:Mycolic acid cyclopropane synthetase-domain-containing protein [Glomus cerebriforme]